MKELSRTISVVLTSLFLVFCACGCKEKETGTEISKLAEEVLSLGKDLFSSGNYSKDSFRGAIRIGENQKGAKRYAVFYGYWSEYSKDLEIAVFADLDPNVVAEVDRDLSCRCYNWAADILKKIDPEMIEFKDDDADGLTITEASDSLLTMDKEGKSIKIDSEELFEDELKRANDAYKSTLEIVKTALKREIEAIEKKEERERVFQERSKHPKLKIAMENLVKLGLTDETNTPQIDKE